MHASLHVFSHSDEISLISARFLGVDASRDGILQLADGRLFLVEAKRMSDKVANLSHHMPEAVGQAIALSELTGFAILPANIVISLSLKYSFSVKTLSVFVCPTDIHGSLRFW
jgi:hypothetical protein